MIGQAIFEHILKQKKTYYEKKNFSIGIGCLHDSGCSIILHKGRGKAQR
jgi:hypothetical protein